jgi:hypothetical protein
MSFELDNPEIAGLVALYKDGQIAYQDAKDKIVKYLLSGIDASLSERLLINLNKKAKELLLGKETANVQHDS